MTDYQHDVLAWFEQNRIGATPFEGQWVWPDDIRKNPALAFRLWDRLNQQYRIVIK